MLEFTALVVLGVDGDELLDPARAKVLVGKGVDCAMNSVVLDDVSANALVLTVVADDDVLLPNTSANRVRVVALVTFDVVDNTNAYGVTAPVTEEDMLLHETAADADEEVQVIPAVLVTAVSSIAEGPYVPVLTAPAVFDVDRDGLIDPVGTDVLVGTDVEVAMSPVALDDVCASTAPARSR